MDFERKLLVDTPNIRRNIRYKIAQKRTEVQTSNPGTLFQMGDLQGRRGLDGFINKADQDYI